MQIKYISGGMDILYTDTIILYDQNSNISISIDCKPEYDLNFWLHFVFKEDKSLAEDKNRMDITANKEDNSITFTIYNAENPVGIQNVRPIEIATLSGKKTYLSFKIARPQNNVARTLSYTIFRDK